MSEDPRRDPRTDPAADPARRTEDPPVEPLGEAPQRDEGNAPDHVDPDDQTRVDRSSDLREREPMVEPRPGGASPSAARDPDRTDTYPEQPAPADRADVYTDQPAATGQAGTLTDDRTDVDRTIDRDPSSERQEPAAGPGASTEWSSHEGLLPDDDLGSYQQRWDDVQVRFIDEPRQSVREADDLVGEITSRIAERFTTARQDLEQRWEGGNEPTTEELRQALQRYRDFFQRLVAR